MPDATYGEVRHASCVMRQMRRLCGHVLVFVSLLFAGGVFAQGIPAPAAMTPGDLVDGDTFYVMFVTSTAHPGNLATAADYDAAVNATAQSSAFYGTDDASLTGLWRAFIAHDDGTNRADVVVGAFSADDTVPIYRIDGTRLANDRADLLDNTIAVPINVTELGSVLPSELVWTGMLPSGATLSGLGPTGSSTYGQTNASAFVWLEGGSSASTTATMPLYVVSPLLRVGAAAAVAQVTPVPLMSPWGAAALAALVGLAGWRRNRPLRS